MRSFEGLKQSRADSPCSWRRLELSRGDLEVVLGTTVKLQQYSCAAALSWVCFSMITPHDLSLDDWVLCHAPR